MVVGRERGLDLKLEGYLYQVKVLKILQRGVFRIYAPMNVRRPVIRNQNGSIEGVAMSCNVHTLAPPTDES